MATKVGLVGFSGLLLASYKLQNRISFTKFTIKLEIYFPQNNNKIQKPREILKH